MERRNAPLSQLYEERLQLLEVADRAGFWGYHKAEHHFIDLDAAPSSNLFLAAASQRTSNIRFGPLVYLLPFYHPLRLIEEVCALDHLCGGRLEIGVGKGISPPEHRLWGLDPERARSQFEEGFRILREGLASERIDFVGEHYQFHDTPSPMVPHEGRAPAFWYPGNVAYAGRYRLNTVASGPISSLAQASKDYRRAVDAADENWNHTVEHPTFAVKRHIYIGASDADALARIERAYPVYHNNLAALWKQYNVPFPNRDPSFGGDMHAAIAAQDLLVGSVETVAQHLRAVSEQVDTDYFIGAFMWGDLSHREGMDSLQRFIDSVIPRFAT